MASNNRTQRINRYKTRNPPLPRQRNRTRDHNSRTHGAENERPLKALEQAREFFEERSVFDFFRGGAPRHIDFEEVAEEGLRHVEGNSAKEDGEKEQPFEVFEDWGC